MNRTILIIEDEKPAARRLQRMLEKEGYQNSKITHSVSESVKWLQNHPEPGFILADIRLPDGLSFEIFDKLNINTPVIFTTAYDKYAIQAFKLNSIDYLLKPVTQSELHFALQQLNRQKHLYQHKIQDLIQQIQNRNDYKTRFSVRYGTHLQSIPVEEICCFYSADKITYILTRKAEEYIYEASLEKIENQINPKEFFRVNRQFIVRFNTFKDIISYSNSRLKIILNNPKPLEIIVARERVKKFKNWLEQ